MEKRRVLNMAKVWNPFSKAYWTKENLFGTAEERQKVKEAFAEIGKENKGEKVGKKVSSIGWKLTWMITIPILLTAFFGIIGMIIGAIIFLIGLASFKR
jgi:hypothetical protein